MRRLDVTAGETIIEEGEQGDTLYLVASGMVEASQRRKWTPLGRFGRRETTPLRTMAVGDCFGEIGLLFGGRRTATVKALEDSVLLSLGKADFDEILESTPTARSFFVELSGIRHPAALGQPTALPKTLKLPLPFLSRRRLRYYWWIFLAGLCLTATLSAVALVTDNRNITAVAIGFGSLVVPVTYVLYLVESEHLRTQLTPIAAVFLLGVLLVYPMSKLGRFLNGCAIDAPHEAFLVGFTEETAKALVILVVFLMPWRERFRLQIDGLVLGAATGMGFAFWESVQYALCAGENRWIWIVPLRSLFSPFVHATWTAIFSATLWREWANRESGRPLVIASAWMGIVILHGAWNLMAVYHGLALFLPLFVAVVGYLVLSHIFSNAIVEQGHSVLAIDPELKPEGRGIRCRVCAQGSHPGSHYCARCGAALRSGPTDSGRSGFLHPWKA